MMSSLALYGTTQPPAAARLLTAGPLSVALEGGNLRDVRWHGVEIIRAISFLVRSPGWATHEPELSGVDITETADSFRVRYDATVRDGAQTLGYVAAIEGGQQGLTFTCAIKPVTAFETCRTGFVVLHPASAAGHPVAIDHADGSHVASTFPTLIDPVQPMRDLRALTHCPALGLMVTCRMEGDVFEMEDQRNWTDASFKTYVRPLSRPWPYTLPAGESSTQSVALTVRQDAAFAPPPAAGPVVLAIGPTLGAMPPLALGCTATEARAALRQADRWEQAGVRILVCRFDPAPDAAAADLGAFRALADRGHDIELQVVVHEVADFAAELRRAAAEIDAAGLRPSVVAVSPASDLKSTTPGQPWPPSPPLDALYRAAREAFPAVRLGGGMFSYFTELNRRRPPVALLDLVTFSTSPLVHAADDRSVMESLQSLPAVAASVRAIAGDLPFVVGPSAIGLRDNPYGAAPLPNPDRKRLAMTGEDPRQRGQFNAAWTFGYVAGFAAGGAARIAVSAPVGPFGILDAQENYPVFEVIRGLAALRGATLRGLLGLGDLPVAGLVADTPAGPQLWLANLGPAPRDIVLPPPFERIAAGTLRLEAYEVVRHTA